MKSCHVRGLRGYSAPTPNFGTRHVRVSHLLMSFLFQHGTTVSGRRTQQSGSCSTTFYKWYVSPSATDVYCARSDGRTRLTWQPHHVISFSRRQLVPCCLVLRWMFSKRCLQSSSASWYFGLFLQSSTCWCYSGLVHPFYSTSCVVSCARK